jgi:succinoglycan biosynthesis transport protein ExoP
LTKRDIIIFIFKWGYGLLGYWFLIIGISVLVVYTLPQKFEAKAKILIESNRAPVMRADVAFGVEQLSVLNSEVAIIRSNPVFQATADRVESINKRKQAKLEKQEKKANPENPVDAKTWNQLGVLLELLDKFKQWMIDVGLREESSSRELLIQGLESRLKIAPQANSNVIIISYTSDDPKMAATIVNTVTEKYIDHHLKIYSSLGISEVYRLQIERMEEGLKARRDELADYKRDKSVTALNETMRSQVQRQTQLSVEQSAIERELAELLTRFGKGHTKVQLAEERLLTVRQSLNEITEKLQNLEVVETVIQNMDIEINSMELTIQSYKKLFQDEQLVNLANPEVANVLIIEEAVAPSRPTHSRLYYILLATIGGFLVSLAIAIIREYFDHRVTDPRVAAQLLGVPTLGSIEKA